MSDAPKRPMDENDAIKKMLDRLRKTVIDAPAEEEESVAADAVVEPLSLAETAELVAEEIEETAPSLEQAPALDAPVAEAEEDAAFPAEIPVPQNRAEGELSDVLAVSGDPLAEEVAKAEEKMPDLRHPNAFEDEDFLEEDAQEPDEDVVDDSIVSQFFTLDEEETEEGGFVPAAEKEILPVIEGESTFPITPALTPLTDEDEELSSVSADDFLSALSWEGENAPVSEEEVGIPDTTFLAQKANAPADAPVPPKAIEVQEPAPAMPEKRELARNPLSFFSPSPMPASESASASAVEEEARTEITDKEAQDLFASNHRATFGATRGRYLASEEGSAPPPVFDTPIFATEENGYAVEVAVKREEPATDPASQPAEEIAVTHAPEKTQEEAVVETVDDGDYADDRDDAFLSLIGKLDPQANAVMQKKKAAKQETAASRFGRPASGEQLSMDIFTPEEKKPEEKAASDPGEEVPACPPATPVSVESITPTAQKKAFDAVDAEPIFEKEEPFFGEMPTAPAPERADYPPVRASHRPIPFDAEKDADESLATVEEPLEVELAPDENASARALPVKPQKEAKQRRPLSEILKAFFTRLAPAAADADVLGGLYTEEAAAYNEFSSRSQISAFARRFVSEGSLCTLRILLLAFLSTFLLVLENFSLVGYRPGGILAGQDMQIALHLLSLLLCAIASIPLFSRAWRQLFARRVTADLYPAILLLLSIVYDVVLYLLAPAEFAFFGLIPAVAALFVAIADHRKVKGDFASFRLLSSSGDKLGCTVTTGGRTAAETDAVSDLSEGQRSRIVSMKKIGFATGFFRRIVRNCEDSYQNTVLLVVSAVASLGVAIVTGVVASSFATAFYAFALTFSLVLPAVLPLLHKIPTAMLSLRAALHHCAVVGEVSALEYSDAAAMTFEDVEAFPAKKMRIQRIKLYHDSALDRVLYQVASLFSTVGGPLDGVFRASTAELGIAEDVTLLRVEEGGLLALVDGREISVGRGEYMLDHAIHVFYDPEDEKLLSGGKTSVMFAAEDGQLVAKFYIRYKMDEEFEKGVEALHKRGIRTLVRTFDPNLSEELVDKISYTADFGLRVVKKEVDQQRDLATPELNSGIVTKTSSGDVLRALFACRRAMRLIRVGGTAAFLLAGLGVVGAVVLAALSLLTLPSVYFVGYQLILALAFLLISKISV